MTANSTNSSMACAARAFADSYFKTLSNDTGAPDTTHRLVASELPGLLPGFRNSTLQFPDACPRWGITPADRTNETASVVKISELGDPAVGGYSLWLSNCDMTSVVNATKTGVYVIQGGLAYILPERRQGGVCGGLDRIAFQTALLPDYCRADASLPECAKVSSPPASSAAAPTSLKSSSAVALLCALLSVSATSAFF